MIIDQLNVFFDDVAVAASKNSTALPTSIYSGRFPQKCNISVLVKGANAANVTFAVKVQESEDNAAFTDVATFSLVKKPALAGFLTFKLPEQTKQKFVRLSYTATGTVTGLTIFAAVTRDDFQPYSPGQYVDHGKVYA
jgi:hypothetical protein